MRWENNSVSPFIVMPIDVLRSPKSAPAELGGYNKNAFSRRLRDAKLLS